MIDKKVIFKFTGSALPAIGLVIDLVVDKLKEQKAKEEMIEAVRNEVQKTLKEKGL